MNTDDDEDDVLVLNVDFVKQSNQWRNLQEFGIDCLYLSGGGGKMRLCLACSYSMYNGNA
jgi:hypothetical protein